MGALLAPSTTGFQAHGRRSAGGRTQSWGHGLSLFGDLKYPPGFPHFDYVDPHAPKGGTLRQAAFGTYDNFNMVLAGWKGKLAAGVELIYDTLLTPSLDEPSAEYGLLAEAVNASGRFLVRHVSSAMPRMTGIELHRRLAESGYAIPTILITAYPDDSVRARALADGIICYLV